MWALSKYLDDLAVRTRNCAHWCETQASTWDRLDRHDGHAPENRPEGAVEAVHGPEMGI
jgi:hypothetical protein